MDRAMSRPSSQIQHPSPTRTAPDGGAVDPDNRMYEHMSLRGPALVVLGIAVLIVVVGVVASALASGSDTTLSIHTITIPDGTVVPLTPAATAMKSIVNAGEPPADVLGNLAVPSGSAVVRTVNSDQGVGQFDRTVDFRTGLSSDQVGDVYRTLLPRLGWKVTDDGSPASRADRGHGDPVPEGQWRQLLLGGGGHRVAHHLHRHHHLLARAVRAAR